MGEVLRRWWSCALDVEGLALDAVRAACSATRHLARRRGISVDVTTTTELVAASFAAIEHLRIDGSPAQGWAPLSGFFQAHDGWVRLHGNYPHHARAITGALTATGKDDVAHAVAQLTAYEVEERICAAGGIATVVRTEQDWVVNPHARCTTGEPWHSLTTGDVRATLPPGDLPMSGVRVPDLTRVIAGPTCSQLLACMGADVLRVDPPHRPELPAQYLSNGMGKRSAEADLSHTIETLRTDLLGQADVILLGYRPGSLRRFGLDVDSLAADYPRLVIGSLSAWGEHGPWGQRAGFDSIVQAATGIADLCRSPDGHPGALPVQALDHSTGLVLASRVMTLLADARGGVVRASLLGAARVLLAGDRNAEPSTISLDVPTVMADSPHGRLITVPPPVMLNGRTLVRPVAGYGADRLTWT